MINNKRELIKRTVQLESNAFISSDSEAVAVNPNIWDRKLREFEEANLVVSQLASVFDFRIPGSDWRVTIDDAPSAASDLVETTDVSISAFTTRSVLFTPTEKGAAYQLTRNEAVRAFFDVAERMTRKLGYSMALKKDSLAITELVNGATTSIFANAKTVSSDVTSTDTLNYADITKANATIEGYYYTPKYLVINQTQKKQLLDLGTVNKANEFGTRDAVAKGLIGELFGLQIFVTQQIATSGNRAKAMILGVSGSGENALGLAVKRDPIIEREYHARGRYWDIVGHEEYDFAVLHPNAVVILTTYA